MFALVKTRNQLIAWIAHRGMEASVAQDNHLLFELSNEPLKGVVGHIGRVTVPPYNQSPLIQQETQFAADNPPVVGAAFTANLLGTAAFAPGVDQLDAIGVNDPEHRRSGQEDLRPVVMRFEETKEPGAFGKAGKQRPLVACQPAREGSVADAFEGMEEPQGDHLTGPEAGIWVFGDGAYLLVDLVEQRRDKIDGAHRLLRSWQGCTLSTSVEEVHDYDNRASMYYYIYWFVRD